MKKFLPLITSAKHGDNNAMEELILDFRPLFIKHSSKYGYFDEDCFQVLVETFIHLVNNFEPEKYIK